MIGYVTRAQGEALTGEVSMDPPTFAHPSLALAAANALAQPEGSAGAVIELVPVDREAYSCCCPTCFVAVGGVHDCTGNAGSRVVEFEAVYRPQNEVRS